MIKFLVKVLNAIIGFGYGSKSINTEVKAVKRLIKSDIKIAFDIGANKGIYSSALLKNFPNIKLFLFEPSSHNFNYLKTFFSRNENVNIYKNAVGNIQGKQALYSNFEGSGLASLTKRELTYLNIKFDHEETVQTIKLDSFLKNMTHVDFIKIDVEGHELEVLNGIGEHIKKVKCIQFEFGGCNISTRTFFKDFYDFFHKHNFTLYRISPLCTIKLKNYREEYEFFKTTNYICINNN